MLDADDPECVLRCGHQGIPPYRAVMAVAELQRADTAVQQKIKSLREGNGGDFRNVCCSRVFRNDLHEFGVVAHILEKLAERGFIEF